MQLSPRYEGPPILRVEGGVGDAAAPLVRQRERLTGVLSGLDAHQWAAPSRCEGWSVQDVVSHLVTTNQFWALSITSALAGEPTRFLATFDPVASPAQMVDSVRSMSPDEVLEHFVATTDALSDAARSIGRDEWKAIGEAPPGHVTLHEVVLHALWDSWIHERDVVVPLGLEQPVEPDEVIACLRYAAALAPAFSASTGSTREGRLGVETTDPDSAFVVEAGSEVVVRDVQIPAGTPTITGDAVALVDALSIREPLQHELSDADEWMVLGLATVFDQA